MTAREKKAFLERMAQGRARARAKTKTANKTPAKKAAPRRPVKAKAKKAKRRNPDTMAAAAEQYERFHGRRPERTIEHAEAVEYRAELAELGKLIELRIQIDGERRPVPLIEFGRCQLTCTPDGRNIYFVGGNQTVDLDSLNIATDKDYVELGECGYVRYLAKKGFHNFEPVEYFHEFGEEDGIRPILAYDAVNRKLFLLGGNYQCRPEGIVN